MTALSICCATMPGLTTVPMSAAQTTRWTRGRPPSIDASTTCATMLPKLSCIATPRARPGGQRRALAVARPAGALGRQQQHGAVARRVVEQRQSIGERVLVRPRAASSSMKHLVEEGVVRMADRAPVADRHAAARRDVGDALAGDAVGLVEEALARGLVGRVDRAGEHRDAALHPARRDRVAGAGDAQRDRLARRRRGRRASTAAPAGPIEVVADVFLARPDELHRPAAAFERDAHRLADRRRPRGADRSRRRGR